MLKISGNKISLTRGDSAYIALTINMNDSEYTLNDGDKVRIQVRNMPNTGELIFEGNIEISDNLIVWHIYPDQTKSLDVTTYYWDAQLETSSGDIFTFIPASTFKLLDEVTMDNE